MLLSKKRVKCHHIRRRCCHHLFFSAIIIAYLTRTRSLFFISSKLSPCAHNHAREEVAHAGLNYIYWKKNSLSLEQEELNLKGQNSPDDFDGHLLSGFVV